MHLSMITAATAFAVLAITGAAFMKETAPHTAAPAVAVPGAKKTFINTYWWYSAFDGSYNDYQTLSDEIYEMEIDYDCTVNTTPGGGTLIEKGYWPNNNPNYPPMYFLYAHFR